MESTFSQFKNYCQLSPSKPIPSELAKFSGSILSLPVKNQQISQKQRIMRCGQDSWRVNCGRGNSISELEKKLAKEFNLEEDLVGMRKLKEKCKGVGGMIELLECLEREAIMGEDEGREAIDYNRRAQIFDRSDRVFQALKGGSSFE